MHTSNHWPRIKIPPCGELMSEIAFLKKYLCVIFSPLTSSTDINVGTACSWDSELLWAMFVMIQGWALNSTKASLPNQAHPSLQSSINICGRQHFVPEPKGSISDINNNPQL
jgi:hypothetical protein